VKGELTSADTSEILAPHMRSPLSKCLPVAGFALLVLTAATSIAGDGRVCSEGKQSRLSVEPLRRPKMLRHDQNIGADALVLASKGGKELFREEVDDAYLQCLGFNEEAGVHLVGTVGERGAWMVLGAISYLSEAGGPLRSSAFDREEFLALSSLTSSKGRFVAFVGGHLSVDGLFVLDTLTDKVRRLGNPPLPPPTQGWSCEERFGWGSCWADGYVELEKAVMHFEGEDVLVVSYGKDTGRRRATERSVRRFRL
jgi:hypothetical protein